MKLGVTLTEDGVLAAVFSTSAEAIELCTYDSEDRETGRYFLSGRTGDIFHAFIPGIAAGTRYGLRAHGPWEPWAGQRFNQAKLLLDPFATRIDRPFVLHPALFDTGDRPGVVDSAPFMPKAIIGPAPETVAAPTAADWSRLVIYELHVRGFSRLNQAIPAAQRGTFAGLAHPASIAHLKKLGVTAVEVLPVAAWVDERHLPPLGLANYWGYNPIAYCAPDPRLAPGGFAEIAAAVAALRDAGIATIIDVVFNHSGESDELGPTLSMRGLDNAHYYRLKAENPALYSNEAGCGNVLACDRPGVIRLVMDALRLWANATGADGFRFDLASILGRTPGGFDAHAPLLAAIAQDPVLRDRVLIAEPWDIGANGYQLGAFGPGWGEWNDRFRDTARRFWRGDGYMRGDMATRVAGSADIFAASRRGPARGINYITAHDGFTLRDLVSYSAKHNEANGEQNRDGSGDNLSWNHGVEGETPDPGVKAARTADLRALLATLLLSRGTPMLTMGDEGGRTQHGNNNAYAQDNEVSWLDWAALDQALVDITARLIALRLDTPALHADRMLTGAAIDDTNLPDVVWLNEDGTVLGGDSWHTPDAAPLIAVLYSPPSRALLLLNPGQRAGTLSVPSPQQDYAWHIAFDSAAPENTGAAPATLPFAARSVVLLLEHSLRVGARATGVSTHTLQRLARQAGLALDWWDVGGTLHVPTPDALQSLLASLRLPAGSEAEARESLARLALARDHRALPLALAQPAGAAGSLRLGAQSGGRDRWLSIEPEHGEAQRLRIAAEDGFAEAVEAADGSRFTARRIPLPALEAGRYTLRLDGVAAATALTVAPPSCYLPADLAAGGRQWGIAAHLYSLCHAADQGIGDFTALEDLARLAGREGADLVGLNPLHALFETDRTRASPYYPSDRRFLDPIYVDVGALGSLAAAPTVQAALAEGAAAFTPLRALPAVDYPAVWEAKNRVLRAAFAALPAYGEMAAALDAHIAAAGQPLRDFAVWEAISAAHGANWRAWPAELRAPDAAGISAFAQEHADRVRYSAFLQFLAERALSRSAATARDSGLRIGLYRDLAVGCAPDGAEAWSLQSSLLQGASIGAPPDLLGPLGQVWGLPPPHPLALEADGYRGFANLLAVNMRHAGALRIDHVMGLTRLFVVPDGAHARDGTYLAYDLPNMLGQVTLESHRAQCLVVGEDLGTVPPEISRALQASSTLSYRVLWFERDGGTFRPPSAWPALAAACVSTHDLPTLAGWWQGADITEQQAIGLLTPEAAAQAHIARQQEKADLLALLHAQGLLANATTDTLPLTEIHTLVARTPSMLALVQADDLTGETIGLNLPGTDTERPNWRRRLGRLTPELSHASVLEAMRGERRK